MLSRMPFYQVAS